MDIIERAANLLDCSRGGSVCGNPNKNSLFTEERVKAYLKVVTKQIENVQVTTVQGMMGEFAMEIGAKLIAVRGLRNTLTLQPNIRVQ
ncbi:MAG: hypothetical protein V8Q32_08115 [Anaerotignum faecicola]